MDNSFHEYMNEHHRLAVEFKKLNEQLKQKLQGFKEDNMKAWEALEKLKKSEPIQDFGSFRKRSMRWSKD